MQCMGAIVSLHHSVTPPILKEVGNETKLWILGGKKDFFGNTPPLTRSGLTRVHCTVDPRLSEHLCPLRCSDK